MNESEDRVAELERELLDDMSVTNTGVDKIIELHNKKNPDAKIPSDAQKFALEDPIKFEEYKILQLI